MVASWRMLASWGAALPTRKESVLESESDTKLKSKSQPRLHRFPTPGSSGEAKELDEACCWGKEITNASKHCQVQLSPYPRGEHQKYQAVLALVRASASLTTRTRSLSGACSIRAAVFAPPTLSGPVVLVVPYDCKVLVYYRILADQY